MKKLRKIIEEEYNLLFESKRSAYEKYVKTNLIPINMMNILLNLDPSNNFQYIEKICQFFLELLHDKYDKKDFNDAMRYEWTAGTEEKIGDAFRIFNEYLQRKVPLTPEEKNIYNYKNWDQFIDVINKYRDYESNTQKAKAAKAEGAPWEIVHVNYRALAKELGAGTKWCISAKNNNLYFHYRLDRGECFYFLIKGMKKYILAILSNEGQYKITNQQDTEIESGDDYHESPLLIEWGLNNKKFPYIEDLSINEKHELAQSERNINNIDIKSDLFGEKSDLVSIEKELRKKKVYGDINEKDIEYASYELYHNLISWYGNIIGLDILDETNEYSERLAKLISRTVRTYQNLWSSIYLSNDR